MSRHLTPRQRFQWTVALAAAVLVVYLVLGLVPAVIAGAMVVAFAVPPLVHQKKRGRAGR